MKNKVRTSGTYLLACIMGALGILGGAIGVLLIANSKSPVPNIGSSSEAIARIASAWRISASEIGIEIQLLSSDNGTSTIADMLCGSIESRAFTHVELSSPPPSPLQAVGRVLLKPSFMQMTSDGDNKLVYMFRVALPVAAGKELQETVQFRADPKVIVLHGSSGLGHYRVQLVREPVVVERRE